MWALSNIPITSTNLKCFSFENYNFYLNNNDFKGSINSTGWYCDGHFRLNREHGSNKNSKNVHVTLEKLYIKYTENFIKNISGNFIIIKLDKDHFSIYSDRFGIKKFFYFQNSKSFIISDSLQIIKSVCPDNPSENNIALYVLMYHFVGGRTLFGNIHHNKPAEEIKFNENNLTHSVYWEPEILLSLPKQKISIHSIAEIISVIIRDSLYSSDVKQLCLSLTGGADTRNLLAQFLSIGFKPHLYTYGNPDSADCIKAAEIAKGLKLDHIVHDINMDSETFENYARKIIRINGGLSSIHRAHRLIAVEFERIFAQIMFLGTLGGEFIRGVSEDDYIAPSIVYENWQNDGLAKEMLDTYFTKNYLKCNEDVVYSTLLFLNEEPYFKGSVVNRKFNALTYITAHLHDAQDINLYSTVMEDVFTPYLHSDYLELLFSSEYAFNRKELFGNTYLKRIENPVFASRFLKDTYKPLLKFNYSGEHRPSEVIVNKYLAAFMKVIRQKLHPKYLPNFSLDNWMEKFVRKNLPICYDYNILKETFNLDLLTDKLAKGKHIPKESYWIKFTNPIMMRYIIEELNS